MSDNKKYKELNKDELCNVTGGESKQIFTKMECQDGSCGYKNTWQGDFINDTCYECPNCKKYSLIGVSIFYE